ncbi:MAG: glycosyltransferase family 61 protein, partial [Nocardioidaceae bacterium]
FVLVVAATGRDPDRAVRMRRLFFHLRPGGTYFVRGVRLGGPRGRDGGMSRMLSELFRRRKPVRSRAPLRRQDTHALSTSATRIVAEAGHVAVTNRTAALAKLHEEETQVLLESRGPAFGRVLERRAPVAFESRCVVDSNDSEITAPLRRTMQCPAPTLREYHDVVCRPGQVLVKDNVLLPDTYRHNRRRRLRNLHTTEIAAGFAVPRSTAPVEGLPGRYFFLDSEHRGHFGHATTEQLSRLWGWPAAKRAHPDLKALVLLNNGRPVQDFERALYGAAGIDEEDLVLARGPVRVETLVAATPMFSQPEYVHPGIVEVWDRAGDVLDRGSTLAAPPTRIFCGRRGEKRTCRNAGEVEAIFRDHGFEVLYPEDYPLADQARLFRRAEVVAGFAGSAMFSLLLRSEPTRAILVTAAHYSAQNEYLISAVRGHRLHLVACEPDPRPPGRRPAVHKLNARFTFDPEREGSYLAEILGSLNA